MNKIPFILDKGGCCNTPCPNGIKIKDVIVNPSIEPENVINVGSILCMECEHNSGFDEDSDNVNCNYGSRK